MDQSKPLLHCTAMACATGRALVEEGLEKSAALTAAYAERNAVVLAFAYLADHLGWPVGQVRDEAEPDWPVLMIDTPAGQVSWHFKAEEMPPKMPPYPGEWDGHSTPEKYERLATLIRYSLPPDREPVVPPIVADPEKYIR